MQKPEIAGNRKTNGILFLKNRVCIQWVQFKNARFAGEHVIDMPEVLSVKLLAYMTFVQPVYGLLAF